MHGPVCAHSRCRVHHAANSRVDVEPDGRRSSRLFREAARLESARSATKYESARSGARGDRYGDVSVTSRSSRSFDSQTVNEGPAGCTERHDETVALHSLWLFFKPA